MKTTIPNQARAGKTSAGQTIHIVVKKAVKASSRQVGGDHYMSQGVQPWEAMESWMSPEQFSGFLRGNAIKYLARCDQKGGVDDVKKAHHYIEKLIEVLNAATDKSREDERAASGFRYILS